MNGVVYHSLSYKRRGKSCSYFVEYVTDSDDTITRFGIILCFAIIENEVFCLIQRFLQTNLNLYDGIRNLMSDKLQNYVDNQKLGKHFIHVTKIFEFDIINASSLVRRVIFVPSDDNSGFLSRELFSYQHD